MKQASQPPANQPLTLWTSAALFLLSWLPAAAMCFYAKQRLLDMHGFRIVARSLGRLGADDLSSTERLMFYKDDTVLLLVVVPWLLLIALRFLRPTARLALAGTVGIGAFLITFVQMNTFDQVGRFGSFDMFLSGIAHLDQDPELLGHFLSPRTLIKIGVPCVAIAVLAWMAWYADPRRARAPSGRVSAVSHHVGRACLVALLPMLLFGSAMRFEQDSLRTSYHKSVLLQVMASLAGSGPVDTTVYERLTDEELTTVYRRMTRAPQPRIFPDRFGAARDKDVILFVCETGPARYLDLAGDLSALPTLERLRERAFVASRHHSTYPYTNRALFSFYSSLYPSSLTRSFNQQLPHMDIEALPARLAEQGYRTGLFSPVALTFENDDRMYRALGFDHLLSTQPDSSLGTGRSMRELDMKPSARSSSCLAI